ncbi:uncharacterized protein LOC128245480 [Mya arenaria]|uniref:uncharacterized protein LOC128245480 n=1 Tax=Mya arenaria TaxID=6604 RepID=UPI0022E8B56E|nr:uncharacterized protein LOC128245480 [Mya arenaria]
MDKARKKDTDRIQRWREDIDAAKLTLAETKSRLEAQDKNANHIYVTARHAQQILGDMQTLIKKVETENMVTRYKFSRDKKTEDLLMWEDVIGKVIEHLDFFTTKWNRATDINIMTPEDTKTCLIRGSAVLRPDTLLLADLYNQCLKTLDLTTGKVTSRLSLYEKPWDVCVLPEDRAAVTLSYGHQTKVQFINTGNALETDKYIVVSAFCRGIAHQDGRLYLTFPHTSPRIEVRTMNGDVLQTIGNSPLQDKVFYGPSFLTISRDDISTIYVSDKNRTLLQMSLQGEVLQKKSYEELVDLGGLADVGGGQVIVCCSNTVMVISGLDGRMKTILETNDGMKRPYTVAYCPTNKKLLVGGNDNRVNVYDLANQ